MVINNETANQKCHESILGKFGYWRKIISRTIPFRLIACFRCRFLVLAC